MAGKCDLDAVDVKEAYLAAKSIASCSGKSMQLGVHMNVILLLIES